MPSSNTGYSSSALVNAFQPRLAVPVFHADSTTPSTFAVAPAKGHHDPHPRRSSHPRRHRIAIGLVNGVNRRRNSNLCNQRQHLPLWNTPFLGAILPPWADPMSARTGANGVTWYTRPSGWQSSFAIGHLANGQGDGLYPPGQRRWTRPQWQSAGPGGPPRSPEGSGCGMCFKQLRHGGIQHVKGPPSKFPLRLWFS